MSIEFGIIACLILLVAWVIQDIAWAREEQRRCPHLNAEFRSLDGAGMVWNKYCPDCKLNTPYKVTVPARSHPDNKLCYVHEERRCECVMTCSEERKRL